MTINSLPTRPNSSFDNPDFVHLKSLSDMLKNIELWAVAANAQVQILLAKRAPVLDLTSKSVPTPSSAPSSPDTKADLRNLALSIGIPESIINGRDYLNGKSRPTLVGLANTKTLIDKAKAKLSEGEDPSVLWAPDHSNDLIDG